MRKYIVLIVLLFYSTVLCFAQADVKMPLITPPSPNASSLGIFGDIPVGHYTGIPNISMPLYEITSGKIKVPITLQYHASGIKVAQDASWVGLGWALNAGGVISRTVRGWDDLNTVSYGPHVEGFVSAPDLPPANANNFADLSKISIESLKEKLANYENRDGSVREDPEPDLFYYNFGQYSGKMIFPKQTGTEYIPLLVNQDPISMKYFKKTGQWIVTTPEGVIYYFGTLEIATSYVNNQMFDIPNNLVSPQPTKVTSWYLDSIRSHNHLVTFEYKKGASIKSPIMYHYSDEYVNSPNSATASNSQTMFFNTSKTSSQIQTDEILLEKINFEGGKINFETKDRDDIAYNNYPGWDKPQKLEKIIISNTSSDILTYNLLTDYFNRNPNDADHKRLRLNGIADQSGKKHSFSYFSDNLPPKTSFDIDHWGYYNAAKNPKDRAGMPPCIIKTSVFGSDYRDGADRKANDNSKMGVLDSICYPTGGYTKFEYDIHDYWNTSPVVEYETETARHYGHTYNEELTKDIYFEIKDAEPFYSWQVGFYVEDIERCSDVASKARDARFSIFEYFCALEKLNDNGIWLLVLGHSIDQIDCSDYDDNDPWTNRKFDIPNGQLNPRNGKFDKNQYWYKDSDIKLKSGKYRIRLQSFKGSSANVNLTYKRIVTKVPRNKGGGLRLSNIRHYDGTNLTSTAYEYKSDGELATSGILMSPPLYYVNYSLYSESIPHASILDGYYISSGSLMPLASSASGNFVGYSRVVEVKKNMNNETLGKTEYIFENKSDLYELSGTSGFLPGLSSIPSLKNGLPKRISYFNNNGKLIKKEIFEYKTQEVVSKTIKGLIIKSLIDNGTAFLRFHDNKSEWNYLDKSQTNIYDGDQCITQETQFYYDNNRYKQLSKKITSNSNGITVSTEYKYPYHYMEAIYREMTSRNMINSIIEEKTSRNSSTTHIINDYAVLNNFPQLSAIKSNTGVNKTLESRIQYHAYDSFGNPLHISRDDATEVIYLWSYNGQYPIAEIKNATYAEVEAAVKTVFGVANIDALSKTAAPDEAKIKKDLRLNNNLKNAHVTTYTYHPLIGLVCMVDPAGVTVYYEHDAFGRLIRTKDSDGNLIQTYDYHYQTTK